MKEKKQNLILVLLFSCFCLSLYFNSFRGIFIFDDAHSIVTNLYIKDIRHIPMLFKGYYTSDTEIPIGMFRPLLLLTFYFNYLFSGIQPFGYHIINILLHFLNGILFFYLLRLLFAHHAHLKGNESSQERLPFAFSVLLGLLFLSHPLHTEAVTYISSRSDLMMYFFTLLSFICYLKRRFWLTLFLYTLSLLTKETALVLPLLIFAYHLIYIQDTKNDARKEAFFFCLALIALSAGYWLCRNGILASIPKNNFLLIRGMWPNILTQAGVTFYYIKLFFWPHPLTIHHNFPILNSLSDPRALSAAIAIILLVILGLRLRKRFPLISFGLAWYFICLLPKFYALLNIVASEHHFYLPSFGIYLILAVLTRKLFIKFSRRFIIVSIGIIGIFAVLVWFRNYEYKDEHTFWKSALGAEPTSAVACYNLGVVYLNAGLYPEAEEKFRKAQGFAPKNATNLFKDIRENIATLYMMQGKDKEALVMILENIQRGFYNFGTYQNLGLLYQGMKDDKKAEEAWQKGLSLNPTSSGILYNLAMLYTRKKALPKAKEYFRKAIEYSPDFFAPYFGLGTILEEEGEINAAITLYEKTANLKPDFLDAHYRLGTLYAQQFNPKALKELKITITLSPQFAAAHNNLAVLYASMDPPQLALAREYAQKAIALGYPVSENFLKIIGQGKAEEPQK